VGESAATGVRVSRCDGQVRLLARVEGERIPGRLFRRAKYCVLQGTVNPGRQRLWASETMLPRLLKARA